MSDTMVTLTLTDQGNTTTRHHMVRNVDTTGRKTTIDGEDLPLGAEVAAPPGMIVARTS